MPTHPHEFKIGDTVKIVKPPTTGGHPWYLGEKYAGLSGVVHWVDPPAHYKAAVDGSILVRLESASAPTPYVRCKSDMLDLLVGAPIATTLQRRRRGPDSSALATSHPHFLPDGAETGRWSCREPNLQNAPRPDDSTVFLSKWYRNKQNDSVWQVQVQGAKTEIFLKSETGARFTVPEYQFLRDYEPCDAPKPRKPVATWTAASGSWLRDKRNGSLWTWASGHPLHRRGYPVELRSETGALFAVPYSELEHNYEPCSSPPRRPDATPHGLSTAGWTAVLAFIEERMSGETASSVRKTTESAERRVRTYLEHASALDLRAYGESIKLSKRGVFATMSLPGDKLVVLSILSVYLRAAGGDPPVGRKP